MARRMRYPKQEGPLPPPLPPESRTIGQLVAESIRLYGSRFWPCLLLGVPMAVEVEITLGRATWVQAAVLAALSPVFTLAFMRAVAITSGRSFDTRTSLRAWLAGTLVFLPVAGLVVLYWFPAVAWLALVGLVVPVILLEGSPFRAAFPRAVRLGVADYFHAFGGLVTISLVTFLTQIMLALLLHSQGQATARSAAFLTQLVVSPLLYLCGALLYVDQEARLARGPRRATTAAGRR